MPSMSCVSKSRSPLPLPFPLPFPLLVTVDELNGWRERKRERELKESTA
jgi:hypothetical protein